jgi:hypothetical protein
MIRPDASVPNPRQVRSTITEKEGVRTKTFCAIGKAFGKAMIELHRSAARK